MDIIKEIKSRENKDKAKFLARFFKTGKGEYAEGDVFLGIMVPESRKIAEKFKDMPMNEVKSLLASRIHEHRLIALMILIEKYKKGAESEKRRIFDFYLKNSKSINNWDLVDLSAPQIVGNFLLERKKEGKILYSLARSKNIWEKRIAIVSTFAFIKNKQLEDTFKISEILLKDKHDLIHKAVGWMLREAGKRDIDKEREFLKSHCLIMPRTMLRYAIEKFDEKERKYFMKFDGK